MRKNTKCSKTVESMLYQKFQGNEATWHGNRMERFAGELFTLPSTKWKYLRESVSVLFGDITKPPLVGCNHRQLCR